MNILVDLFTTQHGGGAVFIRKQLKYFNKICPHKLIIVLTNRTLKNELDEIGVENIYLLNRNMKDYIWSINRIIREKNIDVVYSPNNFINPFVIKPSILVMQNVKPYGKGIDKSNIKDVLKYFIIGLLTRYSERVSIANIYVSEHIKSLSYRIYPKDFINYHGIELMSNIKINKDYFILTVSAGSMKHKNIGVIIDSLNKLNTNIKLKIAGKLEGISGENTEYLGYMNHDDLLQIYSKAKIYISASREESFGMTPMEAMSVGTPCILSDIPVYREIYGNSALYFDPDSPEELAEKIDRLLNDDELYKELVNRGYDRIKHFSWEKNARKLLDIIEGK